MAVVIDPQHGFKPFNRAQRCRLQSFTHLDFNVLELSQANFAHSLKQTFEVDNIHRSYSTPCFSIASDVEDELETRKRIEIVGGRGAPGLRALVVEVAIALASGVEPISVSSGLGGAYFLPARNGDIIAVAKPTDEEPLAFNNPKGFGGLMLGQPGLKRSVRVGETGIRELAAYLLDHDGFAGVPPTALVKITDVEFNVTDTAAMKTTPFKIASLQRFVDHEFDAGELGSSGFSVASVHRIGIFDVRLLNLDRHAGNLLVKKQDLGAAELVPIDHGLCLPEWLDDPYFEWLHWPQASVPFSDSEIEYISNLDPFKDAEILRTELPSLRESSIRVLVLSTIFLKRSAAAGLCLADIGQMMTREFRGEENQSVLETLCAKAKTSVMNISVDDDGEEEESNDQNKDNEEEFGMFQFDNESEDHANEFMDLPRLLQNHPPTVSKPPKIPKFSTVKSMPKLHDVVLSPLYEEKEPENDETNANTAKRYGGGSGNDEKKVVGCFTKSLSFSEQSCNYHDQTGGITLGDMSECDWESFLESFEKLLPQVFEGIISMGVKQRLGSSCEF
ncbi:hypothetical protein Ddye_011902 [Dipteronia dyeriana]|uniref:1-phosphatidylinositol 4-kinase n=1 Tax=Dipteronia dyeriana TaxID=168575 RepID=A0AAE0CHT2_9ROSI|nr:hypothetical protein Ddye_011902 [Dipteronia dyeriana]